MKTQLTAHNNSEMVTWKIFLTQGDFSGRKLNKHFSFFFCLSLTSMLGILGEVSPPAHCRDWSRKFHVSDKSPSPHTLLVIVLHYSLSFSLPFCLSLSASFQTRGLQTAVAYSATGRRRKKRGRQVNGLEGTRRKLCLGQPLWDQVMWRSITPGDSHGQHHLSSGSRERSRGQEPDSPLVAHRALHRYH